jgi:hypothetical protein
MSAQHKAAWALLAMLALVNTAYAALIAGFGYDDILREPPARVLAAFHAAGPPLVLAWAAFAAGALAFAWVGPLAERAAGRAAPDWLAPAAGLAQAIGLLRWVTAVPVLAAAHQLPGVAGSTQQAVELVYVALHQFAGAGIGELLGQLLNAAWTCRFALQLRPVHPWLAAIGLGTLPLWLLGLSEPLATALPGLPLIETTPFAFMAWAAWLAAIAIRWLTLGRAAIAA